MAAMAFEGTNMGRSARRPLPSVAVIIEGWAMWHTNTTPPRAMPHNGDRHDEGYLQPDLLPWCYRVVQESIAAMTKGKDYGLLTALLLHVEFRGDPIGTFWLSGLAGDKSMSEILARLKTTINRRAQILQDQMPKTFEGRI